eukprot:7920-Heterococcus_DN1.PRE.2
MAAVMSNRELANQHPLPSGAQAKAKEPHTRLDELMREQQMDLESPAASRTDNPAVLSFKGMCTFG